MPRHKRTDDAPAKTWEEDFCRKLAAVPREEFVRMVARCHLHKDERQELLTAFERVTR